ncbi:glucose-6-phosphate isomerase [Nosema bombycis CQ1]|uniref:Glucose-6-phosphate isomerase n=1 Tax=Nosema bombycis (strain CQ1 / CVCC 102059) TaxID=578461 RepID=R0MM51_NOSB1|nr:glucose-6-phosphate isomerase [Nosema bombycis CQ1]|eukprot:EOB13893.1 glucose-6-phosphate isomerase [Nosema bombycis CQ1]
MKIINLFEEDKERVKKFSKTLRIGEESIYFDFSKTHLSEVGLKNFFKIMDDRRVYSKIKGMFEGEKINFTENREVLHVYLRDKEVLNSIKTGKAPEDSRKQDIYNELLKMKNFIEKIDNGEFKGVTNKKINTIVNIGIGGSDLGPRMVCEALRAYSKPNMNVFFISNIDATDTIEVFKKIDPESTLFIVVSKTFTTLETIENFQLALRYMSDCLKKPKEEVSKHHFVAVSSNIEETKKHNIENVFAMWDFVGGRYSLWSPVGLIIALYIGFDKFIEMLEGASLVDEEFKSTKDQDNIEIFHAIIELYYSSKDYDNKCIVPYDQYLEKFYLYLQQAEMESNGKYSEEDTGMIIWGGVGTNVQHSFFQLLHQGTRKILSEFLFPMSPLHEEKEHHFMVLSNCIGQSRALMLGKEGDKSKDFFEGDKPSITIAYSKLSPRILGALLAHYEHKIFVQGIYWNINSFDQFGVTLGKTIAKELLEDIKNRPSESFDESTNMLLKKIEKK